MDLNGQQEAKRVERTWSRRQSLWPVLTRPRMAGFEVTTEAYVQDINGVALVEPTADMGAREEE